MITKSKIPNNVGVSVKMTSSWITGIKAITFDLDDTLWPCAPAVAGAERAYLEWIERHYPTVLKQHDSAQILSLRRSLLATEPDLINDVTELRKRATQDLLIPFGASESDISECLRVCIAERQKVSLYDDVPDALEQLASSYRLGSITNGNADLGVVGILHHFDIELAATMALPAKPSPDMFNRACEALEVVPECVLHVGDNPQTDVAAAWEMGMRTAWMNRSDEEYPTDVAEPDVVIKDMNELLQVLKK